MVFLSQLGINNELSNYAKTLSLIYTNCITSFGAATELATAYCTCVNVNPISNFLRLSRVIGNQQ